MTSTVSARRLPGGIVQAKMPLGQVAREHLEVTRCKRREVAHELRIAAVKGFHDALPGLRRIAAAHDANQPSADRRQAFQPLEAQEATQVAVGTRQQYRSRRGRLDRRQRGGTIESRVVDEFLDRQVRGEHVRRIPRMHGGNVGRAASPLRAASSVGELLQAAGGVRDHADRHFEFINLLEQHRQRERRQ